MTYKSTQKVYYADTDAYGVVWHGSYLRFLEAARVDMCENFGYTMSALKEKDIVMPVVHVDISYKSPAHVEDILTVETDVLKYDKFSITFKQLIKSRNKICIEAEIRVVAITNEGKLYRGLPQILVDFCKKSTEEK